MDLGNLIEQVQSKWGSIGTIVLLVGATLLGYTAHKILFKILKQWGDRSERSYGHLIQKYLYHSTRYVLLVLSITIISPILNISFHDTISHLLTILLIGTVANLCIQVIGLIRELFVRKFDVKADNNLHARKVYTQLKILERIANFLIVVFAIAIALMTFERIREIGVSLLASAGIAGIIIGFAAQKSLGNILAGIQIAIAQPIRMDDIVIIEGEWGRIEEITLTYVVLKLWDERRLIVPINYFIEKPFQNWTRTSTELIGSVVLYTDYAAPIEEMRNEFNKILSETNLWDQRSSALQVTNANEKTIEIRMLASASNSGAAFDLRCLIREKMISFLQNNYPDSLPRTRMEINNIPEFKAMEFDRTFADKRSREATR